MYNSLLVKNIYLKIQQAIGLLDFFSQECKGTRSLDN
jgi:hypothetical protein